MNFACSLLAVLPLACGGNEHASDANVFSDGPKECNAIHRPATTVTAQAVAAAPPVAQGGTLTSGNYLVTAATYYTGVSGASGPTSVSVRFAMSLSQTDYHQTLEIEDITGLLLQSEAGTVAVTGTTVQLANTCPDQSVTNATFDASPTEFTLYSTVTFGPDSGGSNMLALTFTKQ
jgi:hypothetical protein